jgi:LysR family transcriptional regulator, glycine cleavage system transcriptional activator
VKRGVVVGGSEGLAHHGGRMDGRPMPSVESLRCFVAVAEHLSFRRAAAEVALTPAALTQRIKQLEEQLGAQLFDRSPRHVELTQAGRVLLQRARTALAAIAACGQLDAGDDAPVRFSLGTRFELGMSWIVPALGELRTLRPHWSIDLVFGSSEEILDRLEQGRVDAIVTSAPTAHEAWSARVLHPETYVLVAAPALVDARPLDRPEQAADHTLLDIDRSLPLFRYAQSVCPGLVFGGQWSCGTAAAIRAFVCAGQGVAVLPEYMVREDLNAGRLRVLLPDLELLADTFRLLYRRTSALGPILEQLADELGHRPLT